MQKISLNKNWEFYESNESTGFMIWHRPEAQKVDLPHDFIINKPRSADAEGGPANAYFQSGEGVYKKVFHAPEEWAGRSVILDIDGAYMNAEVELNGEVLALHPYGYTPFLVDLTESLKINGSNKLKIITQSRQPSTRWYSGGGIYREVNLWLGGEVFVKPWDVFVTTPVVSESSAEVRFDAIIHQLTSMECGVDVRYEIFDADAKLIATQDNHLAFNGKSQIEDSISFEIQAAELWDIDRPYRYDYRISISKDGDILDISEGKFGIRSAEVSVTDGFSLNGRSIDLKGGCIHHDNGLLGACAYAEAEERKIRLLKECGYNAVRISHNPPSLAMLEACDKLGMLLLDECFDSWRLGKSPLDYHLYFEDWWERDIEAMVKRDRNHPSVISYSIGNEIAERNGKNKGAFWSRQLADKIRSFDSTRFIMSGLCGVFDEDEEPGSNFDANTNSDDSKWAELTEAYCEPLDVVGYNYLPARYEADHKLFPERVIVSSESHAFTTYDYWQAVKKHAYVIGDFIWAAVDYLGEVGVGKVYWDKDQEQKTFMAEFPWRTSWQSDLMLTGERRPQSYYRELMWEESNNTYLFTTHPKHYGDNFFGFGWHWYDVDQTWSFPEEFVGKMVPVSAYSRGTEVEFRLNGKSLGYASCERLIAKIDIPYQRGVLEAISYSDGVEISRATLQTIESKRNIEVTAEKEVINLSDGLAYLTVSVQDGLGVVDNSATDEIFASVSGAANLLVIGSGSPATTDQIGDPGCHLFKGTAQIILQLTNSGRVAVEVTGTGYDGRMLELYVNDDREKSVEEII